MNEGIFKYGHKAIWGVLGLLLITASPSFAAVTAPTVSAIAENIVDGSNRLPGMVSGLAYLLGLLLGVTGILKLKEHVENPTQTPLRIAIVRFIIGGALLSLPIIYEAMARSISGTAPLDFDPGTFSITGFLSGGLGFLNGLLTGITGGALAIPDVNGVLAMIIRSVEEVPAAISAVGYLLGLLLGVAGLLKIKDHVENPDQTPLREGVIRLLVGGALFALPAVYNAMSSMIAGSGGLGILGLISDAFTSIGFFFSSYAGFNLSALCNPVGGFISNKLGASLCGIILHVGALPAFLSAIAYLMGLVLGLWGILKVRDHVLDPRQTSIWEGVSRFIAGGMFFALPVVVAVMRTTLAPTVNTAFATFASVSGYRETAAACDGSVANGLDGIMYCMMSDLLGPIHVVLNFFTFVAGMILIMIGISRLTKGAQEGARGPGGFGTIMTFMTGGALLSYNELIRVFTGTMSFGSLGGLLPTTATYATLSYTGGMSAAELAHAHTVISAVLKFMIVLGLISFVRGIFIIRSVAEGNGQASLMAGVTHMVGGALAVNLGPLMNAVQSTLGIAGYGIAFT